MSLSNQIMEIDGQRFKLTPVTGKEPVKPRNVKSKSKEQYADEIMEGQRHRKNAQWIERKHNQPR